MPVIKEDQRLRNVESMIDNYVNKTGGHLIVVSDDRLFTNVFRRTMVAQLGLPQSCLTVVANKNHIMKTVKEMSIKKKRILVFIEAVFEHERMDETIMRIMKRIKNADIVVLTVETDLPRLALLREKGLAENWIAKPIVINALILKIAYVIKPPGLLEELIQAAEQCLESGSFKFALSTCRRIFEIRPDSAVAHMIMGDAYKGLDRFEDMIESYEHAGDLDEMFFEPLNKLAEYFKQSKNPERQIEYLERLDSVSPLNIDRKIQIGGVHVDMGNDEEAAEMFEAALSLTSKEELGDVAEVAAKIGHLYAERNRVEAETWYRRALDMRGESLGRNDLVTFNDLGLTLRKQGKWQEAVKEYQKALNIVPKDANLYYNMSLAYSAGKQDENAFKCAQYAVKLDPELHKEDAVICYNLGIIMARAKRKDEAKYFLQQALNLNPAYEAAKDLLAQI